jgi:hypothetical protein
LNRTRSLRFQFTIHIISHHSMSLSLIGQDKDKIHPTTCYEGPMVEHRHSSSLSLTSAIDDGRGKRHAPAALPPGITRYSSYRRLGGPVWRGAESLSPPGFEVCLVHILNFSKGQYLPYDQKTEKQILKYSNKLRTFTHDFLY